MTEEQKTKIAKENGRRGGLKISQDREHMSRIGILGNLKKKAMREAKKAAEAQAAAAPQNSSDTPA